MSESSDAVSPHSQKNRRKRMVQCLEYLKHAEYCQRGTIKDPIYDSYEVIRCQYELCNYVDLVLAHHTLMSCKLNTLCDINGCYSSLKTFLHCKECTALDCFVCSLIKGEKNSNNQIEEKTTEDLDTECAVYSEERSIINGHSENTKVTEKAQIDEIIPDDSSVENIIVQNKNKEVKKACLPDGLIVEKVKSKPKLENENSSSVSSEFRVTQITGFFRTIIGKTDVVTMLDKKLLYFYKYITSIEKKIYDSVDSKEEYLKALLGKVCETNVEFTEYKEHKGKQKHSTVQGAAQFFFKIKVIEMFGSDEINEIILPPGSVMLKLGAPISEKATKRFQKSITPSEREKAIFKMYTDGLKNFKNPNDSIFYDSIVRLLNSYCIMEKCMYTSAHSRGDYYDLLMFTTTKDELKCLKIEKKIEREDKIYSEKYNNLITQFPDNKIIGISSDKKEKNNEENLEFNSVPSVFCYSHFLLLTYSASYQLWKKLEAESSIKSNG